MKCNPLIITLVSSSILVVAFKGVVQLSGFVNARVQHSASGELARKVEGMKALDINITVEATVSKSN